MRKAIGMTSYMRKVYEYTIFVDQPVIVLLMDDGTVWERLGKEWVEIPAP